MTLLLILLFDKERIEFTFPNWSSKNLPFYLSFEQVKFLSRKKKILHSECLQPPSAKYVF